MQNFIIRITQENIDLIKDEHIGCFILSDSADTEFTATFIQQAHLADKLVLVQGNNAVDFYLNNQTDGLIIDVSKEEKPQKIIKEIQKKAPKAILGAISRNRRHEAMLISECEPDFIIFKVWTDGFAANQELLGWYNELFLIQCAAQIEEPCDYTALPSDFVILNDVQYRCLK